MYLRLSGAMSVTAEIYRVCAQTPKGNRRCYKRSCSPVAVRVKAIGMKWIAQDMDILTAADGLWGLGLSLSMRVRLQVSVRVWMCVCV